MRRWTIKRLHANLIRTGSVTQQKGAGRPKTVITEEAKAAASEAFQRSPNKSIRQYQRESDILRHHMMKDEWNGEKFSPALGFEPGFSALRADALSIKPHRILIPMSDRILSVYVPPLGFPLVAYTRLNNEETKQHYQVETANRFAALGSSDEVEIELDVNSVWKNIRHSIHSIKIAAEQSTGYYETKKKKPWVDEDCSMEVSDLQQYTRRDNIMLFGVPEIDEQSTYEVIYQISEVIGGSELVQHDVSVAHRIPSRPGKTRPIIIRFTKSRSRDEWLQLFRNEAKNDGRGPGIATKKVNRDLPAGRITAGDQLTAVTRDLLNKTRVARKDEASPVSKITGVGDVNNL
ncbi:hypothetical protein ANN_18109 [Periplaneta americana]|uniref:Uncharacterized protein n=1 Tax=Periplaneta americana TaxID=6978 RepID=A0ABQ8SMV3_PERAM|nr:hypothetical protein ANN_18109 [Periplaneta americana]